MFLCIEFFYSEFYGKLTRINKEDGSLITCYYDNRDPLTRFVKNWRPSTDSFSNNFQVSKVFDIRGTGVKAIMLSQHTS